MGKYFREVLTLFGESSTLAMPLSSATLPRVLPSENLLSSEHTDDKYLALDLVLEERERANLTYLLERKVLGWWQFDTVSIK